MDCCITVFNAYGRRYLARISVLYLHVRFYLFSGIRVFERARLVHFVISDVLDATLLHLI